MFIIALHIVNAVCAQFVNAFPAQGTLVWKYQTVFDERRNGVVSMAVLLPEDFFAPGALTCPAPAPSDLED